MLHHAQQDRRKEPTMHQDLHVNSTFAQKSGDACKKST